MSILGWGTQHAAVREVEVVVGMRWWAADARSKFGKKGTVNGLLDNEQADQMRGQAGLAAPIRAWSALLCPQRSARGGHTVRERAMSSPSVPSAPSTTLPAGADPRLNVAAWGPSRRTSSASRCGSSRDLHACGAMWLACGAMRSEWRRGVEASTRAHARE